MKISIIQSDITLMHVDAIVNAANRSLMGGGGVDGAIHHAAGPKLLDECIRIRKLKHVNGLPVGEAVITDGYNLPARHVIHTVGPMKGKDDISLLKDCYRNSLKIAEGNGCQTIAFPSISTGAYGIPIEEAVELVKEVLDGFESKVIKEILLVLYSEHDYNVYKREFDR